MEIGKYTDTIDRFDYEVDQYGEMFRQFQSKFKELLLETLPNKIADLEQRCKESETKYNSLLYQFEVQNMRLLDAMDKIEMSQEVDGTQI
jgi:hypothetical protein